MGSSRSRLNRHLTKKQIKELKDKILSDIARIKNKIIQNNIAHGEEVSTKSGDDVDSANDNILKHTELRFATRESLYLKKLNKTLSRIDTEDYGICDECGCNITYQRLIARPTSDLCISCKEESERDELQNFHGRKSKSLGQTANLLGR